MPELTAGEITQLLRAWRDGDEAALDALAPLVYAELHRLARVYMHAERAGHALHSSDLINEAWLRLIDWRDARWQNRAHFFGVAAQMMRRILVDFARERETAKRGRSVQHVALADVVLVSASRGSEMIALDDALNKLAEFDARKSRIVELRFFAGLDVEETAAVMELSPRTVKREWSLARAWLFKELRDEENNES